VITDYHAKYFAHELSRRHSVNDSEKLAGTLLDAQVDLNPHQLEAALFAFKSPLSKGAILADEVGLGKTIEAGLLLSQKWAEGKRHIIIIAPASLRKQWAQELEEKFFLPTLILESKNYNQMMRQGVLNPFARDKIVICSYPFAARHSEELMVLRFDLVVMDEAHRLRNVYRPDNKTGKALKIALVNSPKVLLTATPLQNSLMELYGLVSIIDDYTFGDVKSFRSQYARLTGDELFSELKYRIKPICHRTLRRQVKEYIRYTNRIPVTQEFTPSEDEQALYEMVSEYLRKPSLQALPSGQRTLMTLIMRKLLASSTFAIAGALDSLANKLERQLKNDKDAREKLETELAEDFEQLDEVTEEWDENESEPELLTEEEREAINDEIHELRTFRDLATSIEENAKGLSLLEALQAGFAKTKELGGLDKAIIFTESRRTQNYLVDLLSANGYADKIVLFNGSNNDDKSKEIYRNWINAHSHSDRVTGLRTADMRAALVDYFRDEAQIMIATEAAAEGINLQFCSMLVNYDLPWNPQRIEQRIGRCHRYGQKFDVVVVNFLNRKNAADQRVFELLDEKFQLFSGVFGASDEVLGSIESGVDFEKRIVSIYQECRTTDEIESQFEQLRLELDEQISETMENTRKTLLENFDAEVHDRLKINLEESKIYLNKYEQLLWKLTNYELADYAEFDKNKLNFFLKEKPEDCPEVPDGPYHLGRDFGEAHRYRLGHPLAQYILQNAKGRELNGATVIFDYSSWEAKSAQLEPLVGKSGWLRIDKLSIDGSDAQDHFLYALLPDDSGAQEKQQLEPSVIRRLFEMPASIPDTDGLPDAPNWLNQVLTDQENELLDVLEKQKSEWLNEESQKLDKWADDKILAAEKELQDAKNRIRELKREVRNSQSPEEQHDLQVQIQDIEKSKRKLRQRIFEVEDEILEKRDMMIADIERRLQQDIRKENLFTVRWRVV